MKKVKINLASALAHGAINAFRLDDDKNAIIALCHTKGVFIIPFINKFAYIDIEDDTIAETIEQLINEIIKTRVFADPNISGAKVRYKAAPEHSHVCKAFITAKGICKYAGIEKILSDNGYTVETGACAAAAGVEKNYSDLLAKDSFAKAVYEENHKELQLVGATFSSLNLETKIAYEGLAKGKYVGLILAGPTGTGKSWAGRIIADKMNAPYLTLQIDRGTTVDTIVGCFVPKAGETVSAESVKEVIEIIRDPALTVESAFEKAEQFIKMSGEQAKWEFIPGPLLKAFTEGWIMILEEVNFGDPGVLAKLNEFTDGTLRVTVNGIPYKRNPNFLTIMTMNPGYAGTDPLNVALKGRFAKVNVPALTKDQFCDRMIGYSKGLGHALSKDFFSKLYDFAAKFEKLGGDTMYHEDVKYSVRNAQRLCDCILTKARSLDEFAAAVAIQYINDLTMDNDNSEQVEKLKTEASTVNDIAQLYELYDYADVGSTEDLADLSSFFTISESAEEDKDDLTDEDLDDLMGSV